MPVCVRFNSSHYVFVDTFIQLTLFIVSRSRCNVLHPVCPIFGCTRMSSHRAAELRNIYQEDIHYFVQHGSSLLKKLYRTRPASHSSEQVGSDFGVFWVDVRGVREEGWGRVEWCARLLRLAWGVYFFVGPVFACVCNVRRFFRLSGFSSLLLLVFILPLFDFTDVPPCCT